MPPGGRTGAGPHFVATPSQDAAPGAAQRLGRAFPRNPVIPGSFAGKGFNLAADLIGGLPELED